MNYEIKCGDVLEQLATMADGVVQCCVTSPPYWGLRDYGTAEWSGGDAACDHRKPPTGSDPTKGSTLLGGKKTTGHSQESWGDRCRKCGAIMIDRQIGLEATPDAYVEKMVAVFREVRRVLRDDGTLWLNIGDSYFGGDGRNRNGMAESGVGAGKSKAGVGGDMGIRLAGTRPYKLDGYKPKSLCGIPWRVALALQDDGWWLRSVIVWAKKSPMPESVADRPTSAWEPIFLLAKSERYFYDAEAVKEKSLSGGQPTKYGKGDGGRALSMGREPSGNERPDANPVIPTTRNQRNVWHLGPEPYSEAHFATFPTEIPRRAIMAGSRPGDTILDPFNGSGTTGAVALQHDRRYIGIELNPEYVRLAHDRIGKAVRPATYQSTKQDDAPLFTMEANS